MRSTFRKTFAKYVTLFIVPVVAFSCLFVYINMRTNEKSATNYLDGVQKQMCGELDILYSALENMALHMFGNDAILNFDALSDVEKIQTLDGYVQNVPANVELMFFSRIGLEVYIQGQRWSYAEFEDSEYFDEALNYVGFFTTLNRTSTIRVLPAGTQQNGGEQYASVIAAPVPVMSASQTGCVAFLIRSQYFEELTEKYFPQTDLEFYVFDTMNEVLYRGGTELTEEQLSDVVRNSAVGISERTVGGTDYLVMRNISSQQNMTYVALIPTAELFEYGKADLLSFSTLVLALLILGIVAVLLITKRATRSIERMQEEHRHVEERLDNQNRIIRQMVLTV